MDLKTRLSSIKRSDTDAKPIDKVLVEQMSKDDVRDRQSATRQRYEASVTPARSPGQKLAAA